MRNILLCSIVVFEDIVRNDEKEKMSTKFRKDLESKEVLVYEESKGVRN